MKLAAAVLCLAGSAAAFAPSSKSNTRSLTLDASLDAMPGSTKPIPNFDPLGLADLGSDETLAFFRNAELKNGRCAMLAVTGYLVQGAGIHFPGMLSTSQNISFESLSQMKPLDAWCAVPYEGQEQIIFTIFLAELISEAQKPHYTKGGDVVRMVFPPIDLAAGLSPEKLKKRQDSELNNGRLAMIAIMSFIAAANIPGSVPLLVGNPAF